MAGFISRSAEFAGRLTVRAPIARAFELFSPLGESAWVPGWSPELVHPPDMPWAEGQVFRTQDEAGEAVWVVTRLDRRTPEVEYYRVHARRYVARVRVRCAASSEQSTDVFTSYAFVGLSIEGNRDIEAMTDTAYAEKMERWERWIAEHLARESHNHEI